jgi:NAD+ kinase
MKRVMVVYKKSALSFLQKNEKIFKRLKETQPGQHKRLLQSDKAHNRSLEKVLSVLEKRKWNVTSVFRASFTHEDKMDLVVTVGGDGTLLESARKIQEIPVLSVNSDPKSSVAFYSACNADDFDHCLDQIGSRKMPLRKVSRLQMKINKEIKPILILNDVLLAHRNPAHATRFMLFDEDKKKHRYKSSGIWVSTASGSTAAIGSAGGQKIPFLSKRWQYLVREPYGAYELPAQKILAAEDKLQLICDSENSFLYLDGPHNRIKLQLGDQITLSQSPWPLRLYRP